MLAWIKSSSGKSCIVLPLNSSASSKHIVMIAFVEVVPGTSKSKC